MLNILSIRYMKIGSNRLNIDNPSIFDIPHIGFDKIRIFRPCKEQVIPIYDLYVIRTVSRYLLHVHKIASVAAVKGTAQPVFQLFHFPVDFQRFVRCMDNDFFVAALDIVNIL